MQKMIAQSRFPYRQKMIEAGEEFLPETERDANALRMAGKAKDKDDDDKKRTYRRRDMRAEQ